VAQGGIRNEALSARAPAVKPHHIGGDGALIDKYEAGRIKPALFADPASARASYVGSLPLCRLQAFFIGDAMASEETRQRAAAPADTSLAQYRNDLMSSGCSRLSARICREYFSKGEVLSPRGIGSHVPSS
jgi:hypothetical protein